MHREVVSILKNTYIQYGKDILSDKKKLEAYFSDLLVQYPREKRLLTIAAREDIFLHVFNDVEMNNFDKKNMYVNVISSLYGIESKVAADVVEIIYLSLVDNTRTLEQVNLSVAELNAEKKEYIIKLISVLNNYVNKVNNQFVNDLRKLSVNMAKTEIGKNELNLNKQLSAKEQDQSDFEKRIALIAKLNGTTETEERELIRRAEKITRVYKNGEDILYDVKNSINDENKIILIRNDIEYYVRYMEKEAKHMSYNHQLMYRAKIVDKLKLLYGEKIIRKIENQKNTVREEQGNSMVYAQFEERVKRVAFIHKTTTKDELIIIAKAEEILKTKNQNESKMVYDLDGVVEDSREILAACDELNNYIRILYPHKSSAKPSEKYQIKKLLRKLYGNKVNPNN